MITWKQFKDYLEANGVSDNDEIELIDVHMVKEIDRIGVTVTDDDEVIVVS